MVYSITSYEHGFRFIRKIQSLKKNLSTCYHKTAILETFQKPVSYTHLDVYKRQVARDADTLLKIKRWTSTAKDREKWMRMIMEANV